GAVVDLDDALGSEDALEGRQRLRAAARVDEPLERRDDVVGRHRLAGLELDALAQRVRPHARVLVRLPGGGELGDDGEARTRSDEELAGEVARHEAAGVRVGVGVEAVRGRRLTSDADAPAGAPRRRLRERERGLAGGDEGGAEDRRREAEHRPALDEIAAVHLAVEELVDQRVLDVSGLLAAVLLELPAPFTIHQSSLLGDKPSGTRCDVVRVTLFGEAVSLAVITP